MSRIVFCAAEATPFAKVGGLADVVGSLPKALAAKGDDVMVCIPRYGCVSLYGDTPLTQVDDVVEVAMGEAQHRFTVYESTLPYSQVPIYFFDEAQLFAPLMQIYPPGEPEAEAYRYDVFCRAVLQFLKQRGQMVDILHVHDWHTSSVAKLLKTEYALDPFFTGSHSVLTIHNMAYQGQSAEGNRLEQGLIYADALVAVSPNYAQEIMTPHFGAGLHHVIAAQKHKLHGILNGIDIDLLNPVVDPFLPQSYSVQTVQQGKASAKQALQQQLGLTITHDIPLIGMVGRLAQQKGLDLVLAALPQLAHWPIQLVLVGSGETHFEQGLLAFNATTPNIRTHVGFNLALGQLVYGASDLFLMPSHFEPCGLSQMIALRYGTLPIVRKTGGLADTVFDVTEESVWGNGFVFEAETIEAMLEAITRAVGAWQTHKSVWQTWQQRGMTHDFSWYQSAQSYQQVYHSLKQTSSAGIGV